MNEFLSNTDRYIFDTFEYNGSTFIRESHSVGGVHWHKITNNIKSTQHLEACSELEQQYKRYKKLQRVLKGVDKNVHL